MLWMRYVEGIGGLGCDGSGVSGVSCYGWDLLANSRLPGAQDTNGPFTHGTCILPLILNILDILDIGLDFIYMHE